MLVPSINDSLQKEMFPGVQSITGILLIQLEIMSSQFMTQVHIASDDQYIPSNSKIQTITGRHD